MTAANLFAWIKCRSEQATAEGWNTELALRLTASIRSPGTLARWKASCRISVNYRASIGRSRSPSWPKDMMVRFLLEALKLIDKAMIARDIGGGGITHQSNKSLDEMQRMLRPKLADR